VCVQLCVQVCVQVCVQLCVQVHVQFTLTTILHITMFTLLLLHSFLQQQFRIEKTHPMSASHTGTDSTNDSDCATFQSSLSAVY